MLQAALLRTTILCSSRTLTFAAVLDAAARLKKEEKEQIRCVRPVLNSPFRPYTVWLILSSSFRDTECPHKWRAQTCQRVRVPKGHYGTFTVTPKFLTSPASPTARRE